MRNALVAASLLLATAAFAQSPQSLPLGGAKPDAAGTAGRTTTWDDAPATTGSTREAPGARHRANGQVSPPARINSGVQVIAPERK